MYFFLRKKGFTLIELLIVIAIIGIIAAIAIPNLMSALHKGKQKVTMGDLKSIGVAIESYAVDTYFVPNVVAGQLSTWLEPFHIRKLPPEDGWGYDWFYAHGTPGDIDEDHYSIASGGRDGIIDWDQTGIYRVTSMDDFYNDIIFSNGQFTRHPRVK